MAIVGAVATIGSTVANVSATNKAANAARDAADKNNALQTDIYGQNKANLTPSIDRGNAAGTAINSLLGLNPADNGKAAFDAYKGSTEYDSRLKQGENSVVAALGGKGLLDSGAALKGLAKYGQTFASNEFGNYLGNLQGQQNTGLAGASALAGVGQNYANAVSTNNNNSANAIGNAALTNANSISGALGSLAGIYGGVRGYSSSYGGGLSTAARNSQNFSLPGFGG